MKEKATRWLAAGLAVLIAILAFGPGAARAHCDGMDGPVVKAAQKALVTGDVNLVLIWVQKKDEAAIRKAFEETLAVRTLSPQAKELADRYFFETLVRIHREGEGAAYTGLKPAGRHLGPAIPAADRALESGSAEAVVKLLTDGVRSGLHERFEHALAAKKYAKDNVEAGREFVTAYVEFLHYVEGIHQASSGPGHGHEANAGGAETHKHDLNKHVN